MRRAFALLCAFLMLCVGALSIRAAADDIAVRAKNLHSSSIVVDTHADTTQRLLHKEFDIGQRGTEGHIDIPRMREGNLGAPFFALWIDGKILGPPAVQKAFDQVDLIRQTIQQHSHDLVLATTAEEVRKAHAQKKIAILIGMEGGHMIGNDIRMVRIAGLLGVRYITLSHFYNTEWADSSTDKPAHNGLTDFGKDVVREMNRSGILIDISHTADKTFYDALAVSKAPLIASHSSCRAISNHPRNMSDDMIKALAAKGGVIHINYERNYLSQEYNSAYKAAMGDVSRMSENFKKQCGDDEVCTAKAEKQMIDQMTAQGKLPHVSWEKIIEHIDHAVKVGGVDHVGLGSDFDGATMPEGMEGANFLPKITEALLRKGYSDADVKKILGENTLRVMEQAERVSREMQAH